MYRSATLNSRGQYSAAVLDELESQTDEHVGVLTSKVKMLKDVCFSPFSLLFSLVSASSFSLLLLLRFFVGFVSAMLFAECRVHFAE